MFDFYCRHLSNWWQLPPRSRNPAIAPAPHLLKPFLFQSKAPVGKTEPEQWLSRLVPIGG